MSDAQPYRQPPPCDNAHPQADTIFAARLHFSIWMQAMCLPWREVLHLGRPMKISRDAALFGTGDRMDGIYYLDRGIMRLISLNQEGQESILLYVTSGNLLGESAMFNKMPVFAKFTAVEDCDLFFFDQQTVRERIMPSHPELVENLLEFMAYKVGVTLHHSCEIINPDVRGKVCRLLFDMVRHGGHENRSVPKITQQEMATALGLHRATFSKVLADLKREGILETATRREIVVKDLAALSHYADSPFAL